MRASELRRIRQQSGRKGAKLQAARMTPAERSARARMAARARARSYALRTFETTAKKLLTVARLVAAEMRAGRLPAAKQKRFLTKLKVLQGDLARLLHRNAVTTQGPGGPEEERT